MTGIGIALGFSGLAALSLGLDRHYEQALGSEPGTGRKWFAKLSGWCLIGWAAIHAAQVYGPSVGLAIWAAELTLAAVAAVLVLSYRSRWLAPVAGFAMVYALAAQRFGV